MAFWAYDCDAALFYFRVARGTDAPAKVISQEASSLTILSNKNI